MHYNVSVRAMVTTLGCEEAPSLAGIGEVYYRRKLARETTGHGFERPYS